MALADLIDEESKLFGPRPESMAGGNRVDPARTMSAYADTLSTLAPAQRAYAMAMLASGRPAVVTVPGPVVEGGLPTQRYMYPVMVPAAGGSAQPGLTIRPPNPPVPNSHSPLEQILERERSRASRAGILPGGAGRGGPALTKAGWLALQQGQAMRYAPNGAYAQSVQAMQMAEGSRARELAPTDPRRAGGGMSGFVEQLRGRR